MNEHINMNRATNSLSAISRTIRLGSVGSASLALIICIVGLNLVGCGRRESTGPTTQTAEEAAADPYNLRGLRAAFAKASPGLQVIIDETIGAVRAGERESAIRQFEAISQRKDITKEQKAALEEVIAKLRSASTPGTRR